MTRLSVLFVTYNRADLLAQSQKALSQALRAAGLDAEYVVSDDASDPSHQAIIRSLPFDKCVVARHNEGLGANVNKGLAACTGDYILQVQDDCLFVGPPGILLTALQVLREDKRVGIVQIVSSMTATIAEEGVLSSGERYVLFENDRIPSIRPCGDRPYSDQPHIKRREFCADLGPYRTRVPMTKTELDYQMRVANQARWRVAALVLPEPGFRHIGAERTFNPGNLRARRIQRFERIPVLGPMSRWGRNLARRLRAKITAN